MRRPTITASSNAPPRISSKRIFGLANPLGAVSSILTGTCGTLAAFSSPTSISMLIVTSLRVNLFHAADRAGQIGARLIEAEQRGDLVVIGARQRILRLDHFDVVGHAGLEAVAGLIDFLL